MIINTGLFLSVSAAVSSNTQLNKVAFIFISYRRDYEAERSLVKSEEILHEELSVLVPLLHPLLQHNGLRQASPSPYFK